MFPDSRLSWSAEKKESYLLVATQDKILVLSKNILCLVPEKKDLGWASQSMNQELFQQQLVCPGLGGRGLQR